MSTKSLRVLTASIAVVALALISAALYTANTDRARLNTVEPELRALRERVTRLSYNTASGGGVNVKLMPNPVSGQPTVPLEEVFSFDRNHAMCRVDTNRQAFKLSTYKLGEVVIEPNAFFMSMVATSIEQYILETQPSGARKVTMRGGLSCATEVGQGKVVLGSRSAVEHATYLIEAVDGGIGGGSAGDSFAFTAFFDEKDAPINYSIFGPKFTFTGRMVEGEITITDPR